MFMKNSRRDNGSGTLRKRKDGRWQGSVQFGYKPNGKPNIKYVYGKTETEAKRKLKELIKLSYTEKNNQDSFTNQTVEEYCNNWLMNVQSNVLKPSSYDRKEMTLEKQVYPLLGNLPISQITFDDIQFMINELKKQNLSYSTIKKAYEAINGCFKYAVIKGDIDKNPCIGVTLPKNLKHQDGDIKFYTEEQVELLLEQSTIKYSNGKNKYRLGYGIQFLLYTGLRIGEALALTWNDIDFQNKTVKINKNLKQVKNRDDSSQDNYKIIIQDSTKTKSGSRIVPLNNKSIEALNHIKEITGQYKYVFSTETGNNVSGRTYDTMFRKIQENCGFTEIYGVHALRHTFASLLFKRGVDVKTVSEILGHKDVSVTYNTYIHLIQEQKMNAINLLDM